MGGMDRAGCYSGRQREKGERGRKTFDMRDRLAPSGATWLGQGWEITESKTVFMHQHAIHRI